MRDAPEFPSPVAIAVAHNLMGFDRHAPDSPPCCDACGAPITSGMISLACPWQRDCAMTTPETWDSFHVAFGAKP